MQKNHNNPSSIIHNPLSRAGFTLVEILVAITLFSVIVSIATGGFVNALRSERESAAIMSAQSNVSVALEEMAREVRTGYLFCHDTDHGIAANYTTLPACGCTITQTSAGPVSSCSGLEYYNGSGEEIDYTLMDGVLYRKDGAENGGLAQAITSDNVSIKYLNFMIMGNVEGDHWNPRITMAIGVAPSDQTVNWNTDNLQTTVSARTIDCTQDPSGSC